MPFIPNTPESLIGRTDSKNPATTCRGITSGGRPCRRDLNSSPGSSPAAPRITKPTKLLVDDPSNPDLYCWQHKDQASLSAKSSPGPKTTPILETRESLDTLIDRLGIVEAERHGRKNHHSDRPSRPDDGRHNEKISHSNNTNTERPHRRRPKEKKRNFCYCFTITEYEDEEEERPVRPQPRPVQSAPAKPAYSSPPDQHMTIPPAVHGRPSADSKRPSESRQTSQTSQYLSLIPATASPQTASQLMAELAKPISQTDEAGYIYIFWLTPESAPAAPPAETAESLLAPPRPGGRQRRTSDVLETFAVKENKTGSSSKKVLLKIGRASNVQRRLNEWTRQCGYNLSLIRYYPHISSSQPSTPRKMPHSHKVERLIHLELAGAGLRVSDKANCDVCGKAHREWFEIDASKKGIAMVDETVKRWSDWDEAKG
ncbi:DUF1766-domain-containing protein [Annulohypoxylon maeteangense]|uniref:DUF1766-domain-containing protein n=1 Tax=Annulohypoxylon maeteangense TaxID=1927788 RepID=UPI0020072313|nr:DUF1766-domain-containing protein [Annulohypoxylon maeteangense]KAI0884171.1 DUF1766-domain-containing protein [Annulohypoxylon maeteangense]